MSKSRRGIVIAIVTSIAFCAGEAVSGAISKEWMRHVVSKTGRTPGSDQLADAAIRAFTEAMLSDTAVEAAAEGIYETAGEGLYISQNGKERRVEWHELTALHKAKMRHRSRAAITAALAAIGATEEPA